jgi:hypothetical protein
VAAVRPPRRANPVPSMSAPVVGVRLGGSGSAGS